MAARSGRRAGRLSTVSRDKDHIALSDEHNSRGIELADRGWLDEAIKEFKKAIELDPRSAHAHDNLATVYSEKKLYREALQEYLTALGLEPDSATAHYNLACFLATHGADMAIAEYKVAISLDPKDPFPRHEMAALLMDEGDYRGAIAQLKEVVRLEPDGFEAHLDLGICYAQKGFYAEAERAYARARELSPDDLLLNYNVAALYALWGKPGAALDALKHALASDPAKVKGWLATDPMFDAIKGRADFEALVHH